MFSMDNDTLNTNANTNTASTTPEPASAPLVELPEAPAEPAAEPAVETPAPTVELPEPAATPEAPATAPAAEIPTAEPAVEVPAPAPAAPIDPLVQEAPAVEPSPLSEAPIIGTSPTAKQSPILNSAPNVEKKFDLKYIIPIAVLGVLVLGLGGFLLYDKLVAQPKALETARKTAAAAVTPTITTVESTATDTSDEPVIIPYSTSSSLNGSGTYLLTSNANPAGVSVTSNAASTTAEFSINWAEAKTAYSDLKTSTSTSTYTIDFSQGVTEIFYGAIGETYYYFFLLEDGTVDYLNIYQALSNKSFTVTGPIDDVEDVVKFLTATSNGSATVLAQQAAGDYYDLSAAVK